MDSKATVKSFIVIAFILVIALSCKSAEQRQADARYYSPYFVPALTVEWKKPDRKAALEAIDKGADPNYRYRGKPIIVWALRDYVVLEALVKAGANINARAEYDPAGATILHYCMDKRCPVEVVRWLLRKGADINAITNEGKTVLAFAKETYPEIVPFLRESGAQETIHENKPPPVSAKVQELIASKADLNAMDAEGNIPLVYAARQGLFQDVQALLENGADVNAVGKDGYSAFCAAVKSDSNVTNYIAELLINAKAEILKNGCGSYALKLAAYHDDVMLAKAVISARVNVNARSEDNITALWLAQSDPMEDLIRRAGGKCFGRYSCPHRQRFEMTKVIASDYLFLRDARGKHGNKLAAMPRGAQVLIDARDPDSLLDQIDGISGYWLRAKYRGRWGYAFSGFLDNPSILQRK